MSIQRFGVGPRMSKAVAHGSLVFLAGQVADKAKGQSVTEQTKDILGQIDAILKDAGTDKTKLISANIWLSDMKTFAEGMGAEARQIGSEAFGRMLKDSTDAWGKVAANTAFEKQ